MACILDVQINGITGDCSNTSSGAFDISIFGEAPDYTIQWINPNFGTIPLSGATGYTLTSLSADTYTFNVIDSCTANTVVAINIYISSGTCASLSGVDNTSCGFENGSITATTDNFYSLATFSLYELNSGFITSGSDITNSFIFQSLSAGTYYVIADDGGGCTGKTQSCIIKSSTTLDFGFYVVNSSCLNNLGAVYVTGVTGTPPYSYLWSPNGETTSFITGLTSGNYICQVTDSLGCVNSQTAVVGVVPPPGLGAFFVTQPSCYSSDGVVDMIITGGTAPYYYSASNGTTLITFSTSVTFTGVSAGIFTVGVTDAGLCSFVASTPVVTPNSISLVTTNITNSNCNNTDGEIIVAVFGGAPPFTYTLSGTSGFLQTQTTFANGFTFPLLASDTYILTIDDSISGCSYTQTIVVSNNVLYTLTATTTGATCSLPNGAVTLGISTGGTAPYTYEINGVVVNGVTGSSYTFTNLAPGNYTGEVTDANLCSQQVAFTITDTGTVNFILSAIDTNNGNNGQITAFITDGEPPFTLNWSSNVGAQSGLTVTGLTAGTYSLSVTDDNGCTITRITNVDGLTLLSSYQTFTLCSSTLQDSGLLMKRGLQQLLLEGFHDLTSGDTNCILNEAIFEAVTSVSGNVKTDIFFTGYTLAQFPTDDLFFDTIESLVLSYSGVETVSIDPYENKITITTICNPPLELIGSEITISLKIYYDISCVSC